MQAKERLKVHFLKLQLRHTLNRRFGFYRLGEKTGIGALQIQPPNFRDFSMLPNGQATFTSRAVRIVIPTGLRLILRGSDRTI